MSRSVDPVCFHISPLYQIISSHQFHQLSYYLYIVPDTGSPTRLIHDAYLSTLYSPIGVMCVHTPHNLEEPSPSNRPHCLHVTENVGIHEIKRQSCIVSCSCPPLLYCPSGHGPVSSIGPAARGRYRSITLLIIQLGRADMRDNTTLAMI